MPGAEGNDHVRLMDSQGNTQRTDSVLSPEAIEDADRVGADELSGLSLALAGSKQITGFATGTRSNPSIPASTQSGFDAPERVIQTYSFSNSLVADPAVIVQLAATQPGLSAVVSAATADTFSVEFVNANTDSVNAGAAPFFFVAVAPE